MGNLYKTFNPVPGFFPRFMALVISTWYFLSCAQNTPLVWHFIDTVDLIIHEAGHVIFAPLGVVMEFFGGSLLQILVPICFLGAFVRQRDFMAMAIMMSWAGYNIVDVAIYMADAIPLQLPLLGDGIHDWNFLFSSFGILASSPTIASCTLIFGKLIIVAAPCMGSTLLILFPKAERAKSSPTPL